MRKRSMAGIIGKLVVILPMITSGCTTGSFGFSNDKGRLYSGTIETREIRVGSKIGGRVEAVMVDEGEEVKGGQVLVRFDSAELEAQLLQAEARVSQQKARLEKLERGSRPEEVAQARAVTEIARANLEAIRTWPRPEEVAQGRASVLAAEADVNSAENAFERISKLRSTGDSSKQEYDSAKYRLDNTRARLEAERKRLDVLLNGSRKEDIKAVEEKFRQTQEAERLVIKGPRKEEIADARAQVQEAEARLAQIRVQMSESQVHAPVDAIVEILPVRPGDLIVPNQTVARLLEKDQIWVRIYIPEPQLGLIRMGQKARIKVDTFADRTFDGVIEQINSQGEFTPRNIQSRDERNHQVFGVKVRIDNREGRLKSGMAAEVTLEK